MIAWQPFWKRLRLERSSASFSTFTALQLPSLSSVRRSAPVEPANALKDAQDSDKTIDLTGEEEASVRDRWYQFQHFQKTTGRLGTKVGFHYKPFMLVNHPPRPKELTLELLLASQAHLGHATGLWNPANQRYIFGIRQGIHIISLEIIAAHLRRAAKIVEGVVENGGIVLFVGTRAGQERCVVQAAKLSGGCHLFERWTPGAITNGQQILGRGKVIEVDKLGNVKNNKMQHPYVLKPDLVVCLNPLENYVLLHECGLYAIPTIGIIDTDADPSWVTYPIPANDDSLRAVQLIAGILGQAGEEGKNRRIRKALYEARMREAAQARAEQNEYDDDHVLTTDESEQYDHGDEMDAI